MATANLNELQKITETIEKHNAAIQRGKDLESLKTDPKFISVIIEGYLDAEATRLFEILTSVPAIRKESMDVVRDKLDSIRDLKEYLGTPQYPGIVVREAENAPDRIREEELYRTELLKPTTEEEE